MELAAVDLMAFMLFSQIAIAAYLLYSFSDQEREARHRTAALTAYVEKLFAELEKRLASGSYRSVEDLERIIARHTGAPGKRPSVTRAPTPMPASRGSAKPLQ
jgi:hypothetical protein